MTDALWARIGIIIVNVWLGFPYMMNVCLGGLQAISNDYYEAAKIDGAPDSSVSERSHSRW